MESFEKEGQLFIHLPREIWLHQIIEYLLPLDLIFSFGRVCKVFRYELVDECLKEKYPKLFGEEEENLIDNFPNEIIKYMIRDELLQFVIRYEKQMTQFGIFNKFDYSKLENLQTDSNSQVFRNNSTKNQELQEIFDTRMEIFNFYFSHFYKKLPETKESILVKERRKFLFIGDSGVGKTTLTRSFNDDFKPSSTTRAFEIHPHRVIIGNEIDSIFNIWDTVGQEKFGGLRDACYINSSVCAICFDLTSRLSFKNIPSWFRDIKRVEPECEIFFIGTKNDLTSNIKVQPKHISFPSKKHYPYMSISTLQQCNNTAVMWYAVLIDHFVTNLKSMNL